MHLTRFDALSECSVEGIGYYDTATGSVGDYYQTQDWYQIFTPITNADAYYEAYYGDVWNAIGEAGATGPGFDNTMA